MSKSIARLLTLSFTLCGALVLQGCSDDPEQPGETGGTNTNPTGPTGSTPGGTNTGAGGYQCDPKGMNPAMGDLLNAPLKPDVTVIKRAPKHPGNPGPKDLPAF